jgi:hypothetical protein
MARISGVNIFRRALFFTLSSKPDMNMLEEI